MQTNVSGMSWGAHEGGMQLLRDSSRRRPHASAAPGKVDRLINFRRSPRGLINSRPSATIVQDNSDEILAENRTVYMQNYRQGTRPQTVGSVGLRYNSPKSWSVGVDFNYFSEIYLSTNPDRRTEEAVAKYITSDPQWSQVIDQTKLDNNYTLNLFAMKSFRINDYRLRINVSVNNILNNTDFIVGGFESRFDTDNIDRFQPKYSYLFGRSYFIMARFQF